jgi:alcohol dehydrogenase class IV
VRDEFTWIDGERLIRFGRGALAEAPRLLAERGFAGYALLTTERAARDAPRPLVDGAAVVLPVPGGGVPEAAAAVRPEVEARPLVALGGGRVIDSAKAIAGADALPCAALPTTLSGAEMTRIHRMPAGVEGFRLVRPSLVIGEPSLMASQPMPRLAASAMNALGHAAEALYTPYANPVADRAGLDAAALIARGLAPEEPDRGALALGALLAGYAIGSAGYAVHHVLCQTLVRLTGSPHAETNAVILPHALELMSVRAPEPLARLARAIGAQDEGAELASARAAELAARSGAARLSELGVDRGQLDEVVTAALGRAELRNTPEPPGRRELTDLLERAY